MLLGLLVGCASKPPPPSPAPPPAPPPPQAIEAPPQTSQELGTIDETRTEGTFQTLELLLQKCHEQGLRRIRYLGGDVLFFLRVGEDGHPKIAFLQESTLGDRATEKCLLERVNESSWPIPKGGDAEVHKRLGFDPPESVPKPAAWPPEKLRAVLAKHAATFRKCKGSAKGAYSVTGYVVPRGKRSGGFLTVGMAPPSVEGEGKVDCMVKALMVLPLPNPGPKAVKVTFPL